MEKTNSSRFSLRKCINIKATEAQKIIDVADFHSTAEENGICVHHKLACFCSEYKTMNYNHNASHYTFAESE